MKEAHYHKYRSLFLCSVCASLNFSSKTQRSFCNQAEHSVSFQGPTASQGAFILPSYPLSSPRNSPKHGSPPADSPKKSQDNTMNFANSWPLKSFEGLPKPSSQKQLLSQKPGDNTGGNVVDVFRFAFWWASISGQKSYSGELRSAPLAARNVRVLQPCSSSPTAGGCFLKMKSLLFS